MEKQVSPVAPQIGKAVLLEAGKLVCERIRYAEVRYLGPNQELLFTQDVGSVNPGDTIVAKIPTPEDFTF
jgi:hypothetical protein